MQLEIPHFVWSLEQEVKVDISASTPAPVTVVLRGYRIAVENSPLLCLKQEVKGTHPYRSQTEHKNLEALISFPYCVQNLYTL